MLKPALTVYGHRRAVQTSSNIIRLCHDILEVVTLKHNSNQKKGDASAADSAGVCSSLQAVTII